MLDFDSEGKRTGTYVKEIGGLYSDKQFELRQALIDVNGHMYQYRDVKDILKAKKEDIDYKIEPGSEIEPEIIRFKSGVYLDFSERSFGWNSETNESYNDTIEKKEDYLLNGIRLFDFKKE